MQQTLAIELLEDAIFSARSATEGGHGSLDRIPGAALLGAAAARLYKKLDRRDAFTAFHSGKLRFGDGLPLCGEAIAYPVPFAWYHAKSVPPAADGRLQKSVVHNFQFVSHITPPAGADNDTEVQPKQLRTGYVHADGTRIKPDHRLRLKTAIDPDKGRAAEGQLFGYDALARGQHFAARIEADDDVEQSLFDRVIEALTGKLLLGRSRSAEYGRARAWAIDAVATPPGPIAGERVTLWLLSDLALASWDGQPTLNPDAESLQLPGAKLVPDRSFLRARRYSPWNAARGGFDRERLVLCAGSVITLHVPGGLSETQAARLQAGVGLHREAGLGRLWVNPPLLADPHPAFASSEFSATSAVAGESTAAPRPPDDPLRDWLEEQTGDWRADAEQAGLDLAREYVSLLWSARRLAGVAADQPFGPSKAQWGRVMEQARQHDGQRLFDKLFRGDSAVIKRDAEGWQEDLRLPGGEWQRLADWLEDALAYGGERRGYDHKVRRLAHRVRDDIDRRRV